MKSDIPAIFEKHGLDAKEFIDMKRFTLMKNRYPGICADRIDFFLRDALIFSAITHDDINRILDSLVIHGKNFAFSNIEAAKFLAEKFMAMHANFWLSPYWVGIFQITADMLRAAMKSGIIAESDLLTTDMQVFEKLNGSGNQEIKKLLQFIITMHVVVDKNNYDYRIKSKIRYTDPLVINGNSVSKLSEIDESYRKSMEKFIAEQSEGVYIRIVT